MPHSRPGTTPGQPADRGHVDFEELRAQEDNGTNVTVVKSALPMMGHDCGPSARPAPGR